MSKISTKTQTVHQILCDCGGAIQLKSVNNAFTSKPRDFFTPVSDERVRYSYKYDDTPLFTSKSVPTCTKCGKTFEVVFNSTNFTVIVREI